MWLAETNDRVFVFSMPGVNTFRFINHFNLFRGCFKNLLNNNSVDTFPIKWRVIRIVNECILKAFCYDFCGFLRGFGKIISQV